MSKKTLSAKHGKPLASKNLQRLAENDYVDRSHGAGFNDSDIHKARGITVHTSDNESRDGSGLRTLAQAEEDELQGEGERGRI